VGGAAEKKMKNKKETPGRRHPGPARTNGAYQRLYRQGPELQTYYLAITRGLFKKSFPGTEVQVLLKISWQKI
jgi:hypothetical protein